MPFNIRKPFARRTTDHPVIEQNTPGNVDQVDSEGKAIPHTNDSGPDDGAISSSVDQLKKFKKTHQWDYNLDYDTIVRSSHLLLSLRLHLHAARNCSWATMCTRSTSGRDQWQRLEKSREHAQC